MRKCRPRLTAGVAAREPPSGRRERVSEMLGLPQTAASRHEPHERRPEDLRQRPAPSRALGSGTPSRSTSGNRARSSPATLLAAISLIDLLLAFDLGVVGFTPGSYPATSRQRRVIGKDHPLHFFVP